MHTDAFSARTARALALTLGGVTLALCALALLGRAHETIDGVTYYWLDDDQMISMRYARNLAEGHGLVYNVGERVEGYTNFLWVLVMALVHVFGAPDPVASIPIVLINAALLVVALRLALSLLATLAPDARVAPFVLAAAMVLGRDGTMWGLHGFETPLLTVCHLGFLASLLRGGSTPPAYLALAALPLVRGDGAHLFAADAATALLVATDRPRTLRLLVLASLPTLAHEAFRIAYYGDWLPNTYYVKSAGLPDKPWRGLRYVGRFFARHPVAGAGGIAYAVLRAWRDRSARLLTLAIGPLATAGYCIVVGGDNFPGSRFFVPTLPTLYVALALALTQLRSAAPRLRAVLPLALATALLATDAPVADLGVLARPTGNGDPYEQIVVAAVLREHADPSSRVAVFAAGIVPYFSRLPTLDMLGKCDRYIARLPYVDGGRMAHGKYDVDYVLDQAPDFVVSYHPLLSLQRLAYGQHVKPLGSDYIGALLADRRFFDVYAGDQIPSEWLRERSAVYIHRDSPEAARSRRWPPPEIGDDR